MKKRTGVERAVIVMAVVVVLLAIALIVVNVADIRIRKPAAGPEAPVETTLPQFPFGDEPELILGSGETPARDAEQAVPVDGENKTMQLVTGSFAQRGGPDFSLYLDKGVFLSTELDGKCCFARADDASMETLGEVKLGSLTAYGVKGVTVQRELEAYLIPTANGCISVVLCHAGTAPVSWYDSLLASAQTLQITG